MLTFTEFTGDGLPLDENGQIVPIVEGRPRLFNGAAVLEFENQAEFDTYFNEDLSEWNKEDYANEVNAKHNELFRQLYESKNYLSIGEISLWVTDKDYGTEAQALINWWRDTCKLVEEYLNDVDENTVIENFVDTLPPFEQ